jgi:hypothetical protein
MYPEPPVTNTLITASASLSSSSMMVRRNCSVQYLSCRWPYLEGMVGSGTVGEPECWRTTLEDRAEMDVDLRKVRYFMAVARHGNFSRAAEDLHIAQPVLSRQIRALESELGAVLFVRGRGGAALTQAGTQLAADAEPLLADAKACAGASPRPPASPASSPSPSCRG